MTVASIDTADRFGLLALPALLDHVEEGVLLFDTHGRCRYMGKRVGEVFGIETQVYVGRSQADVFRLLAAAVDEEGGVLRHLQTRGTLLKEPVELDVLRPKIRKLLVSARRLVTGDEDLGLVVLFRDITRERSAERARAQLQARLDEVSPLDVLTGLPNWRRFYDEIEREHGRAVRGGEAYSVLRVDVDHMRRVNESQGVSVGDRVLEELADRMRTCRREYDVLARYEADEFVILLPASGVEAALTVSERLLQVARSHDFRLADRMRVTISVGGALWTPEGGDSSWSEVVRRAGQAVAKVKETGGDAVRLDAGSQPSEEPTLPEVSEEAATSPSLPILPQA